MTYGLYQTLNQGISSRELSDDKKRRLTRRLKKASSDQKEAVLLLICEHARINDGYEISDQNTADLPYGLVALSEGLEFELDKLPNALQRILKKFIDMTRSTKQDK